MTDGPKLAEQVKKLLVIDRENLRFEDSNSAHGKDTYVSVCFRIFWVVMACSPTQKATIHNTTSVKTTNLILYV
jgi:hypothetical protein